MKDNKYDYEPIFDETLFATDGLSPSLREDDSNAYKKFSTQINFTQTDLFSDMVSLIDPKLLADDGIEDGAHVTILYGLDNESDYFPLRREFVDSGKMVGKLGAIEIFNTSDEFDVVYVSVDSLAFQKANSKIRTMFPKMKLTYPVYKPHMTLAYVKKGSHDHLIGRNNWEGNEIVGHKLQFCHIDNYKLEIPL